MPFGTEAVVLLAHQGGWDEILLVAGPIVLIIGLLAVVKRRVDAQLPSSDADVRAGVTGPGDTTADGPERRP